MPALPELQTVRCAECGGQGCQEVVTVGGFDVLERCGGCNGLGARDVCLGCLTVPDAFSDACGCNRVETCTAHRYLGATSPFGEVTTIESRVYLPLCTVRSRDGTVREYTLPFLIAHGMKAAHE